MRAGDGQHHAPGHLPARSMRSFECTLATTTSSRSSRSSVQVERAVLEDVDLDAGEDPERAPARSLSAVDLVELLAQPLAVEAVGDREAGRVVGEHQVLVAERDRRRGPSPRSARRRRTRWSGCGSRPAARRGSAAPSPTSIGRLGLELGEVRVGPAGRAPRRSPRRSTGRCPARSVSVPAAAALGELVGRRARARRRAALTNAWTCSRLSSARSRQVDDAIERVERAHRRHRSAGISAHRRR